MICDTPSTAFFQSVFSGLPTMSLYRPNDQKLRVNARGTYGSSLKPYNNIDEGIELVDKFLDSEHND